MISLTTLSIDPWIIIWTAVIVVTILIEIATVDLTTIWFTAGALIALLVAVLNGPIWLQWLLFILISLALVILTRPLVKKIQNKERVRTNADKVLGTIVTITKEVTPDEIGEVTFDSLIWRAIPAHDESFNVGEKAKVIEIRGNKFVIEKEKKDE